MLNEIELLDKKLADREQKILELEKELEDTDQEFKEFKNDSLECDEKIKSLQDRLENADEERARLEAEEAERRRLEELEAANRPKPPPKQKQKYNSVKGDAVDEKMAYYLNQFDLDIPVQRIGDGQYMFGTKKIYAKIMNDKLVIRVGGGYMLIDEFLATYGQAELDKIQANAARGMGVHVASGSPRRGSPKAAWGKAAGRMSPNARGSPMSRGSPRGGFK